MKKQTLAIKMIAPCGMNCALCLGHMREKNKCHGCWGPDENKPYHCVVCRIKTCPTLEQSKVKFCYACPTYPCVRLKQLDKRYRMKYAMSMLENLEQIREKGIRAFVKNEVQRWKCPSCGELVCVHRVECQHCQTKRHIQLEEIPTRRKS